MPIREPLDDHKNVRRQSSMEGVKNNLLDAPSSIKLFTNRILYRLLPYVNLPVRWSFCGILFTFVTMRFTDQGYNDIGFIRLFVWYLLFAASVIHLSFEPTHSWFDPNHEKEYFKTSSKPNRKSKQIDNARGEFEVWTLLCLYSIMLFVFEGSFIKYWTYNLAFWLIANFCRAAICVIISLRLIGYNYGVISRAKKTANFFIPARKMGITVKRRHQWYGPQIDKSRLTQRSNL